MFAVVKFTQGPIFKSVFSHIKRNASNLSLTQRLDILEKDMKILRVVIAKSSSSMLNASEQGDLLKVKGLVELGEEINIQDQDGQTPLMKACFHGHYDIARFLLDQGANVNMQDKFGDSALFQTVYYGRENIFKLLLEHGADPDITNKFGDSLLTKAKLLGYYHFYRLASMKCSR